jgi:glycosyltransferase involved in cell wall biosynthesis
MQLDKFKVSVIIPVYNAEKYLRKAVESAVKIDSVGEIILVEDKSPDNALDLCKKLIEEYDKVKFFQHSDKGNHGAGASRNLGIQKASHDYIAFLDADDYYLPNRFKKDKEILLSNPMVEGVYSAIGIHYYSEMAKKQFLDAGYAYQEFLTVSEAVPSDELFSVLFHNHESVKGEFSTIAITVKRSVFDKIGYFNTVLKLQQDVHMWKRMAAFCTLEAGELKVPVSMRGVHGQNRMTVKEDHEQYIAIWWKSLKTEFNTKKLDKTKYKIFEQAYFNYLAAHPNKGIAILSFLKNTLKYPGIIKEAYGVFDFNCWAVFGKNWLTLHAISFKNKSFS